jgi:RNA polymerase sigma-70 factor (ECF subfamily)
LRGSRRDRKMNRVGVPQRPSGILSGNSVRPSVRVERDADSRRWLSQLREDGRVGEEATRHLHRLLLRVSYSRLRCIGSTWRGDEDEIALEAADEAVVGVLAHLDAFRGESLFTTWACQFAANAVIAALHRRRRWRLELPVEAEVIVRLAGAGDGLERHEEHLELLEVVCQAVKGALSARQREVLLVLAVDGGSPEALARRLDTNVGALYKSTMRAAGCGLSSLSKA